jgi:ABC-type Fe3+-hydroxamate transport system substrate-binding protein
LLAAARFERPFCFLIGLDLAFMILQDNQLATAGKQVARIVSLVPSQTELLFDLGLGSRVVGVTKFCIHPAVARTSAVVIGGTKHFDFAKIAALKPDLIIGNKEENYKEGIEQLAAQFPVWISDIANLDDALQMVRHVGLLTGTALLAEELSTEIFQQFAVLKLQKLPQSAAYFIWRKPFMVAATGTFIDDMLRRAGFSNVFGRMERYPEITAVQIAEAAPQRIFLSSEPYPFQQKHLAEMDEMCPNAKIEIVDGELFSWYGSRLRYSAEYFKQLQ